MEYWYDAMATLPSVHVMRTILPTTAEEQVGVVTTKESNRVGNTQRIIRLPESSVSINYMGHIMS